MRDYETSWQHYRKQSRLAWFLWLAFVPVVGGVGVLITRFTRETFPIMILAVTWIIWWFVVSTRVGNFRCPRCDRPFFRAQWYHNSFARKCVHCGLPKYSTEPGPAGS